MRSNERKLLKKGKQKLKAADAAAQRLRMRALRKNYITANTLKKAEQRKEGRPLTEKQRGFVREWAKGETIRSACARCGIHHSEGYRLAKDPAILKLYNEEKRLYEEAAQMSRKHVMEMMQEAYDCAKLISEPSSMVAAAREIGRLCGYYDTKITVEHTVGGKLLDRLTTMTDDELLKLIEEGKGEIIIGEAKRIADEGEVALLEAPNG